MSAAALALGTSALEVHLGKGEKQTNTWLTQAESLLQYSLSLAPVSGVKADAERAIASNKTFGVRCTTFTARTVLQAVCLPWELAAPLALMCYVCLNRAWASRGACPCADQLDVWHGRFARQCLRAAAVGGVHAVPSNWQRGALEHDRRHLQKVDSQQEG